VPAPLPLAVSPAPPPTALETVWRLGELLTSILAYVAMYAVLLGFLYQRPLQYVISGWPGIVATLRTSPSLLLLPAVPVVVLVALGFRRWARRGLAGTWTGQMGLGIRMFIVTGVAAWVVAAAVATVIVGSQPNTGGGDTAMLAPLAWVIVGVACGFLAMPLLALVLSLAVGLRSRRMMTRIEGTQAIVLAGCLLLLPCYVLVALSF
jgi:hypothetical protein